MDQLMMSGQINEEENSIKTTEKMYSAPVT